MRVAGRELKATYVNNGQMRRRYVARGIIDDYVLYAWKSLWEIFFEFPSRQREKSVYRRRVYLNNEL